MEFDEEGAALEEQFGAPRGEAGQWACCLRVVDPSTLTTAFVQELDNNECVTAMAIVQVSRVGLVWVGAGMGGAGVSKTQALQTSEADNCRRRSEAG